MERSWQQRKMTLSSFAERKRIRKSFKEAAQKKLQQQIFIVILYEFPAIIFYLHTFAVKTYNNKAQVLEEKILQILEKL